MTRRRMLRLAGGAALIAALIGAALAAAGPAAAQGRPEVVVVEATGPVGPPLAGYIQRGIQEGDSRNAEAVVLMLNTPGGLVNATQVIIQAMRTSDVPVIVFVGPRGAQSASAGLLITLAGHAAAMAPDTAIGASSPIGAQGQDLDSTSQEKEEQYLSAQARSLAERRGDDAVQLASEAVTEARAVSASEALAAGLVDVIVEDVDELLAALDGTVVEVNGRERTLNLSGASVSPVPMRQLERILLVITDPNLLFILLSIGVTALIVEIRTPGGWIAGLVGVSSLGLAMYGLGVLPVNWLGIVFVLMAFVLFLLEIKAPVHGALSAAAVVSLAVGAVILFDQPGIAPFGSLSIPLVVGWSIFIGSIFVFLMTMALRAQTRPPTTGYPGLVGQEGRVTQTLEPEGMVQVFGERWRAASIDGELIPVGARVEVVQAGQMLVYVRRTDSVQKSEGR